MTGELNCSAAVRVTPSAFICPFLIICIVSMPDRMMRAQRKFLNPSIGRVRRLIARWSCSMRLFRYLFWRTLIGVSRSALRASSAARLAPLLSIVTVSGFVGVHNCR